MRKRSLLQTVGLLLPVLGAMLAAAGCTTPEPHQDSGIKAPFGWTRLNTQQAENLNAPVVVSPDASVDQRWWRHFNDPTLNAVIDQALATNKTLKIAAQRVEEARASRAGIRSLLFPQVSGVATGFRGNQGFDTFNETINDGQIDLQASWEVDLFGRNQARTAQAGAILQSSEAMQQGVRVELLSEVARNYFDLRNSERQIQITEQNLATERRTLDLTQAQLQGALASDFDVQRAAAQVSTTEATLPALRAAYDKAADHLNILLGVPPGTYDALLRTPEKLKPLDQHAIVAIPAKVLDARPDVRAAERQLAAAISGKKAAHAEWYPDISLQALIGSSAAPFATMPWSLGGTLAQPILNFGRIEADVDTASAQQKEAFLNYQQTVITALEDMENALSHYRNETARNISLARAVKQNARAADLAQLQYQNGYTSLLDVLVAQRNLLDAQSAATASDADLRKDLIDIYTAAGGGWGS